MHHQGTEKKRGVTIWPFLVIFLTEPVRLSPQNFTKPDGKTASTAKNSYFFQFSYHVSPYLSTDTQYMCNGFFGISVHRNKRGLKEKNILCEPSTSDAFRLHLKRKQGRIHGYSCSMWVERGSANANQVFGQRQ